MYDDDQYKPARRTSTFPFLVFFGVIGVLGWKVADALEPTALHQDAAPRTVTARGDLASDELATIELFESASPTVVHIETKARVRRNVFSMNVMEIPQGTGSGFVWDERGYVVTNFHVIREADAADVILADGSRFDASLVGVAPVYDLAVLKIEAPPGKLPATPVGTSNDLRVGQKVFAIGNPFGLDQTLTTGVISGLDREILSVSQTPIRGVIQTDAAINPGNSGGPLLDSAGRLIGVNTAIYSPSGASSGVGFAVPVDTVNSVIPQLIKSGSAERAGLGVQLVPDTMAKNRFQAQGAMIERVLPNSGAEAAGLRSATTSGFDDIVAIDGYEVRRRDDVPRLLAEKRVGDFVEVEVLRGRRKLAFDVKLSALPQRL